MSLAHKVKNRRIELGWSQDELARRMGYSSRTSINKIENGRPVSQKIIVRLAEVLGTTPSYLMGWVDEFGNEIKEDPIGTAKELAALASNPKIRDMIYDYNMLSEDKKKQARDFIKFLKGS